MANQKGGIRTAAVHSLSGADTWVPSRFNISVDLPDGMKAVYNSCTSALVKVDRGTWRRFFGAGAANNQNGDSLAGTLRLLRDNGFLIPAGVDELDLVRLRYSAARFDGDSLAVWIGPTLACNLQCSYCFQGLADSFKGSKSMDRRTEDATIRYLATMARGKRRVDVVWFGGEPLLGLRSIERISGLLVPALDKAGIAYSAQILTNGVLAGRSVAVRLKACRVTSAQVTVDVPKREKRDRRGRDTLDTALEGVSGLAGCLDVTLRVNMSRDAEAECDTLYETLRCRGLHKQLKQIYFSDVRKPECGRGPCSGLLGGTRYLRVMTREQGKATGLGFPVQMLFLGQPLACMATRQSTMVIGPDGLLYKCPQDMGVIDRSYGSVFDNETRLSNIVPWMTYDWFRHDKCRNCPVLPQCGGGCPHGRLFQADSSKSDQLCFSFLRWNLEDRIRQYAMCGNRGRVPAIHRKMLVRSRVVPVETGRTARPRRGGVTRDSECATVKSAF